MRVALTLLAVSLVAHTAQAQTSDELRARRSVESGEYMSFEFGMGPYTPNASVPGGDRGSAIDLLYDGDQGPMLRLELDGWVWRIPYVGLLGAGFSWGWAQYSGQACLDANCTNRAEGEDGSLKMFPMAGLAVLRIDVLARELGVPFILSGKLGPEFTRYKVSGGAGGSGWAIGIRWAAQIALELDFINPRRARSLDEQYGINHTTLFFEMLGSYASAESLHLGTPFAWTIGLGLHL